MRRLFLLLILALGIRPAVALAQEDEPLQANEQHLSELVQSIVLAAMPRKFENRKHWDKQREVFAGVKVKTDGLKLRISKRKEKVRHGFWRRYEAMLIDPEQTLKIQISDVQALGGGQWTYTVTADLRAKVETRFEHWNLGVKLFNTSTKADASLRMRADCSLQVSIEQDPDEGACVVFSPDVTRVDLALPDLDIRKLGELRGDLAQEVGNGLEEIIEDLVQTQEKNVRKQARKEIAEHKDDLRIPLGDLLSSPWASVWLAQ